MISTVNERINEERTQNLSRDQKNKKNKIIINT